MILSHDASSWFSNFHLSFLLSGCYYLWTLFGELVDTELSFRCKSIKDSSSSDNSLSGLFSSNLIWIASSTTKVIELYTLNAFEVSELQEISHSHLMQSSIGRDQSLEP